MVFRVPRKRWLPLGILSAAALAVPAVVVLGGGTYAAADLVRTYAPHAEIHRRALADTGGLPLWDFHQFGGSPFSGNLLDGYFYPPNVLLLILPAPMAFQILVAVHLGLAALGMYRLGRSWKLSREAASIAGGTYALSFSLVVRVAAGHYGMLVLLAQAPLLLFLVRNLARRARIRDAVLLALFAACVLLGGHPPFAYQLGLLGALFALSELGGLRGDRSRMGRTAALMVGAGGAALLLAAVHLLPALQLRPHTTRGSLKVGLDCLLEQPEYSFLPRDFAGFVAPAYSRADFEQGPAWAFYWHEKAVYLGIAPLLLALLSLAAFRGNPAVRFLALAALAATADAMAQHLPVHRLLAATLPGYADFRVPARSVWIASFCLCALAAFGWDRWRTFGATPRRLAAASAAGLSVAVLLALLVAILPERNLLLSGMSASAALLGLAPRWPRVMHGALLLLTLGELCGHAGRVIPTAPPPARLERPWYLDSLGPDPAAFRLLDLTREGEGYGPALHGVRQLNGLGYPLLRRTYDLYASAWEEPPPLDFDRLRAGRRVRDPRPLDLLNVGWVLDDVPPREPGLVEVARNGDRVLYRRPSARPYAFAGGARVDAVRRADGIRARVRLDAPGLLIVSESWMPGWRARVDGEAVEVHSFEGGILSVALAPGDHEVLVAYDPAPARIGLWISSLALLAVAATAAFPVVLRRRQAMAPTSAPC